VDIYIILKNHNTRVLLECRLEKINFVQNDYMDMYVILKKYRIMYSQHIVPRYY